MNDRVRSLRRRYREELGEADNPGDQAAAFIAKARGDEAGVQAIRCHRAAAQAAGEFSREQDVAKLRVAVGLHAAKAPRRLDLVKIERGAAMRIGSGATMRAAGAALSRSRSPAVRTK